jgi:prepilin-type N-terminal cleavage/methylation domain-containing protein
MKASTTYQAHARGFTLIELLVVIAIIGLLSGVVLASMNGSRQKAGEINLGALRGAALSSSSRVTGMDIAGHGRSFVLITYEAVIEFNFDLAAQTLPASSAMTNGKDFHVVVASSDLPQQEAVAYFPGDRAVIFESEQTGTIMKTDCLK